MMRLFTVLAPLLAAIWLTGNIVVTIAAYFAFAKVLPDQQGLAGQLAGLCLRTWTWVGAGLALVMVLGGLCHASRAWRNQFRAKAVFLVLYVILLSAWHVAVLGLNHVVTERRIERDRLSAEDPTGDETMAAIEAFDAAHELSVDLFSAQTIFLLLITVTGTVIVVRRMEDDA